MRKSLIIATLAATMAAYAGGAFAGDYLRAGVDLGGTGWIKDEKVLTKANLPKMKLLWSKKLDSTPRSYHNLFSPVVASSVNTASGVKEVAVEAGVSDQLWGMDAKTGDILWTKKFDYSLGTNNLNAVNAARLCPAGQTAVPMLEKLADGRYKVWALSGDGRLWQVDAATGQNIAAPVKFAPNDGKAFALNMHNGYVYTALSQGCGGNVFQFDVFDTRTQKSSAFYPAGGGLWGRRGVAIDSKGIAYMGTGDGAYRPETNLGNIVVGVKPDANATLQLANRWAPVGANWLWKRDLDINVSPLVIPFKDKEFLLTTSKECVLYLTDMSKMTGPTLDYRQTEGAPVDICNDRKIWDEKGVWGSISAGQLSDGQMFAFVPFWGEKSKFFNPPIKNTPLIPDSDSADRQVGKNGGVAALAIAQVGGKWQLVPKWLSQNMDMGEEGLLANDIFWVYASGVNARQVGREIAWNDTNTRFGDPHELGSRAVIYALDAKTGKTLWSSGDTITTWNHFSGITVANGKVYTGTFDGTLWCFGVES